MKILIAFLGLISLTLGILGIFLPLLPTTPFLLLSAALFAKSSDKLHNWLLNHKYFGNYIRNFIEDKALPANVKVVTVTILWTVILSSAFIFMQHKTIVQLILIGVAIGVTIHILSFKTKKKN